MGRVKWHCGLLKTGYAGDADLNFRSFTGLAGIFYRGDPDTFGAFARFASFGWIFEVVVVEKLLFAGRPRKKFRAIDTVQFRVGKIAVCGVYNLSVEVRHVVCETFRSHGGVDPERNEVTTNTFLCQLPVGDTLGKL